MAKTIAFQDAAGCLGSIPRPYSGAEKSRRYRMRLAVATGRAWD